MEIKILGTGCGKCKTTYAVIEKVIKENNIRATITKVEVCGLYIESYAP